MTATDWREPILAHFSPAMAAVARLTVVADPDDLLTEPGIIEGIRARGFEILPFTDHVAFRYAYERRFREQWDAGQPTTLAVVLRTANAAVADLPFDLLDQARRDARIFTFSLAEQFPRFAPRLIAELDRSHFDRLFAAHAHQSQPLGENATADFLLRHVFEIDPALITHPAELVRVLLRLHYRRQTLPPLTVARLLDRLQPQAQWTGWPLDRLFTRRADFLAFLQERWPHFVSQHIPPLVNVVAELPTPPQFQHAGPADLPFDHEDIRVYLDNLFTEGQLTPTTLIPKSAVTGHWLAVGVAGDTPMDQRERLHKRLNLLNTDFPAPDAGYRAWLHTARQWAEIIALRWTIPPEALAADLPALETLHDRLEQTFQTWLLAHYAALHSLPYWPQPVLVHQLPHFLAHGFHAPQKRALVVVDGLALDQWVAARSEIPARPWTVEDGALFAWVPTLTSVSRQAIFAGEPPFFFAASLDSTHKEEAHWLRFWETKGLRRNELAYFRQQQAEDDDGLTERVDARISDPKCRVIAVIVSTVDQMIHGAVTGTDGLHASVRHWAQRGAFWALLDRLTEAGFEVFLTADHGNVEAQGIGKPNVGATANERGERVHVFPDEHLRQPVAAQYPGTICWPTIGLPEDYRPLLAPPHGAFIPEGKRIVAHGGIALEEMVVPLIRITRKP
ncbi:MAG TPA: BREX-3 system phosphatase PglZ [Candidatus Competibacteraceae bacterium]|nr:BREX-3 system phosphatase PglZ [Candidatus Competibacteraceae bacterium]HSA46517.1 BREX-3 system phosphatase PglZ [Candidatus Competibacteraceae bacterium]